LRIEEVEEEVEEEEEGIVITLADGKQKI